MPLHYIHLIIAVVFETLGTAALQASAQFTKPLPIVVTIISYVLSFYFMTLVLKIMPVGVVYAIWSGMGIILIAIVGVLVINIFSSAATH